MTGGTNPKAPSSSSSHKNNINNNKSSSSSSSHRKSRWENPNNNNNNNNNNKFVADSNKSEKPQTSIVTPKGKDSLLGPGPSKPSSDSIPPLTPLPPPPPPPSGPQFPDPVAVAGFAPPPPAPAPAPAAAYGFQMLDRRSITLADSSVRSYFALPPDYQDFAPPIRPFDRERERERERDRFLPFGGPTFGLERHFPPGGGGRMSPPDRPYERAHDRLNEREENYGRGGQSDYWKSLGLDARVPESSQKRKFGEEDGEEREGRDKFAWHRQQLLQYGNPNSNTSNNDYLAGTSSSPFRRDPFEDMRSSSRQMRVSGDYDLGSRREANLSHPDVDPKALKNAFLKYVKSVFENKEKYLEDKKQRPLECVACGR
ncbi:hypothetical protein GIB67_012076 [Kingdonia uniflora]|uniref:Uncharacterized protein n=1 Tax=Kingdonia uniflora TaxID=39325 RepID=A0A7J7LHW5_9MAGN|nr:hypothetical protein GIB67_012076 [Kingdonia uniflora]